MVRIEFIALALGCLILLGCKKDSAADASTAAPVAPSQSGGGGGDAVSPNVGAVTPVTSVSLDEAAGGGVNSAALRKAKGVAAEGVSSVNSAQKQGYGAGDDGS